MDNLRGKFIVFDGGEGCGKSTQSSLLHAKLVAAGIDCVAVRDPGSTHAGEAIRRLLLDPKSEPIGVMAEMLLYMAARAQMMQEIILPALDAGSCVLCDRFVSSTLAYQGAIPADQIRRVAAIAIQNRWPDLTILLDMPIEKSLARMSARSAGKRDRIEQRPDEFHRQVRDRFLAQSAVDPNHFRVIDADREVQTVHAEVIGVIRALGAF